MRPGERASGRETRGPVLRPGERASGREPRGPVLRPGERAARGDGARSLSHPVRARGGARLDRSSASATRPIAELPVARAWSSRSSASALLLAAFAVALLGSTQAARADRTPPGPPNLQLAALAPPPGDDARKAVALGPIGQVFEPDGSGGWVRDRAISIADRISITGRAGGQVVALGDGVMFRLAPNGWTAIRIIAKGTAVMSSGPRAVAAIGRQLYAIDRAAAGEPTKLALAPSPVLAIGAGTSIVIALDRGLFRVEGARVTAIKRVPRRVERLVSDRWALLERAALDLRSARSTPWPEGVKIATAASGPKDSLIAVGSSRGALELITLTGTKLVRDPLPAEITGSPVGVASDSSGHAVIAMRDGRLAVRDRGVWTVVTIREALPASHAGAPPATSP